jgi:hypothetical protein
MEGFQQEWLIQIGSRGRLYFHHFALVWEEAN